MNSPIGIACFVCANGTTWEFTLTLDGLRVGNPIWRSIAGVTPTPQEKLDAFMTLIGDPHNQRAAIPNSTALRS